MIQEELQNIPPQEVEGELDEGMQIPQEGEEALPPAPSNPFDTSAKESELSALQEELKESLSAIDTNFAKYFAEAMPDELEDLFFDDRVEFLLKIEQAKQEYIKDKIIPLQEKEKSLQNDISTTQNNAKIFEASIRFKEAYKDADLDTLQKFYEQELSPRQKEEIDSMDDVFSAYEKLYLMSKGDTKEEKGRNLPKQTKANHGNIDGVEFDNKDNSLPINRY